MEKNRNGDRHRPTVLARGRWRPSVVAGRMRDGGKFTLRKVIRAGTRCQRVGASQIAGEPEYRVGSHVSSIRRRIDGHRGLEHPEVKTGDEVCVPFG